MKFHLIAATALLVGSTAVLAQEAEDNEARDAEATAATAAQAEEDGQNQLRHRPAPLLLQGAAQARC